MWPRRGAGAKCCLEAGIAWVDAADVTAAVLFPVSDEARYVTGIQLPIDGGAIVKEARRVAARRARPSSGQRDDLGAEGADLVDQLVGAAAAQANLQM